MRRLLIISSILAFTSPVFSQVVERFEKGKWGDSRSHIVSESSPGKIWFGLVRTPFGRGTGILIGEDLVVTAAHVVGKEILGQEYGPPEGKELTSSVQFFLGRDKDWYLEKTKVTKVWWGRAWSSGDGLELAKHDWAMLKLDRPIGKIYGEMPLIGHGPLPVSGITPYYIAGYSSAFNDNRDYPTGTGACTVTQDRHDNQHGLIRLNAPVEPGDSGGAFYHRDLQNRFGHGDNMIYLAGINIIRVGDNEILDNLAIHVDQFSELYDRINGNDGYFGPPPVLDDLLFDGKCTWKNIDGRELSTRFPGEKFPETRGKLLLSSDIAHYSYSDVRYAINEMFARHGATFANSAIQRVFESFAWYNPLPGLEFDTIESASFTARERANLLLLADRRKRIAP